MDPITQTCFGAACGGAAAFRCPLRHALAVGAVAGALPDIDVLIRSASDPLLGLEYHRHFTHALLIAPVIGLLVAALHGSLFRRRAPAIRTLCPPAIAGALSHGPLDTCTSYGTLLYWPFSQHRESWDVISIIDPLFTLPLALFVLAGFVRRRAWLPRLGLALCLAYLGFGLWQRERALEAGASLAQARGHTAEAMTARPSLGNVLLWRVIYRADERYHVSGVRVFPGKPPRVYRGGAVPVFSEEDARRAVPVGSVVFRDIRRFRFFAQGYLFPVPGRPRVIGDLRYALLPNGVRPLWGIRWAPEATDRHVEFVHFRDGSGNELTRLWTMIRGRAVEDN